MTQEWIQLLDSYYLTFAADILWKATVLLIIACCLQPLFRGSPAARFRVWALSLLAIVLLPLIAMAVPSWPIALLPKTVRPAPERHRTLPSNLDARDAIETPIESGAARARAIDAGALEAHSALLPLDSSSAGGSNEEANSLGSGLAESPGAARPAAEVVFPPTFRLIDWTVFLVWMLGALVGLTPFLLTMLWRRRLVREARVLEDEARRRLLADKFEQCRGIRVLESQAASTPLVLGVWRPVIIVPRSWTCWSPEMRRQVVLHELAHLQRRDLAWQCLARLSCSIFWFHPLAWHGLRRMRQERELACDARVIAGGESPIAYAESLIALARSPYRFVDAIAMAASRRSLEIRIRAVLGPTNKEREGMLSQQFIRLSMLSAVLLAGVVATPWIWVRQVAFAKEPQLNAAQPDNAQADHADAKKQLGERTKQTLQAVFSGNIATSPGSHTSALPNPLKSALVEELHSAQLQTQRLASGDQIARSLERLSEKGLKGQLSAAQISSIVNSLQKNANLDPAGKARMHAVAAQAYRSIGDLQGMQLAAKSCLQMSPSSIDRIRSLAILSLANRKAQKKVLSPDQHTLTPSYLGLVELSLFPALDDRADWSRLGEGGLKAAQQRQMQTTVQELVQYKIEFRQAIAERQDRAEVVWRGALGGWLKHPVFARPALDPLRPKLSSSLSDHRVRVDWEEAFVASGEFVDAICQQPLFADVMEALRLDPDGPRVDLKKEFIAHLGQDLRVQVDFAPATPEWVAFVALKNPRQATDGLSRLLHNDPDAEPLTVAGRKAWRVNAIDAVFVCPIGKRLIIASNRELLERSLAQD